MSQEPTGQFGPIRRGVLAALILLLLLPLLAACNVRSTIQEAASQAGAAMEAAATRGAQGNVTPTRTPKARATPTYTPKARVTPTYTPKARATPTRTAKARVTPTRTAKALATATPRAQGVSGLPTIRYQDLPKQARETIALIEKGGPFPFERDGIVFQNREQLLPRQRSGYYREYTVITPGSRDRGERRIIAGAGGELYYSDDHYESFKEVIR